MTIHKYVRHSEAGFIIWPKDDRLWHKHIGRATQMAEDLEGSIVSAGFADIHNGKVHCFGRSESLSKDSAKEDSALLAKQLGMVAA